MTASCGDPEGLAVGGESQGRMHQELVFPTDSLSWPIQDKDKKRKEKKKSQATHSLTLPNCSLALVLHSLSLPYTDEELPHSSGTALVTPAPLSLLIHSVMGSDSQIWLASHLPKHKVPGQGRSCLLAPPKGALEICKLLQLLLPTQISPLLTTRQTSCLYLINKLLYLFRGVNL